MATAGSCFAQNLAKHILSQGNLNFHSAERLMESDPIFSARYGNIYTAHQLLQLFQEAMNGEIYGECAILRKDGRYVDVNRPYIFPDGFSARQEVIDNRIEHLKAVKTMFCETDVFVFTLGLTEAWHAKDTEHVYPIAPQIYAKEGVIDSRFHNYNLDEINAAMERFINGLLGVNPNVKLLLTVSPVPLTATYTQDHILVATMHSKSILRVVCSHMVEKYESVFYFPSYEMISNPFVAESAYDDNNMRTIKAERLSKVMEVFDKYYVKERLGDSSHFNDAGMPDEDIICDEVEIEKSVGF